MNKLRVICLLLLPGFLFAQQKLSNQQYVDLYYPIAVSKMVEYKIPASITLAQGILESGSGNSELAQKARNHFGIKCHNDWQGEGFYMDDDTENECFRVYKTAEESYADHSLFLTTRARYKFLFDDYATDDYKAWAKGLKQAGYATNPQYPELLIGLIERLNLQQYDKMGMEDLQEQPLVAEPVYPSNQNDMQEWDATLPENAYYVDAKNDVFMYNGVKAVKSKGRQALEIATQYHIDYDKLKKINDIHEGYVFTDNQIVFLESKRNKGVGNKHTVKQGETMWEISQEYGIKMDKLYKRNLMVFDKQAQPGEEVYLKGKRSKSPKTMSYMAVLEDKNKIKEAEEAEKKAKEEAEKKAKEEAAQKKLEAELAKIKADAEKKAKEDALQWEQKQKEEQAQWDAYLKQIEEQNEVQFEDIDEEIEVEQTKTAPEDVPQNKPYEEAKVKTYTVKAGDTLYSLSNKFYVSVEDLKKLNNLPDNNLRVGQVLVVSP